MRNDCKNRVKKNVKARIMNKLIVFIYLFLFLLQKYSSETGIWDFNLKSKSLEFR